MSSAQPPTTSAPLVLIVDTSGNLTVLRRRLLRRAVAEILERVRPETFALVGFGENVGGYRTGQFCPLAESQAALEWLDGVKHGGKAELATLLERLFRLPEPTRAVLLIAGYVGTPESLARAAQRGQGKIRLCGLAIETEPGHIHRLCEMLGGQVFPFFDQLYSDGVSLLVQSLGTAAVPLSFPFDEASTEKGREATSGEEPWDPTFECATFMRDDVVEVHGEMVHVRLNLSDEEFLSVFGQLSPWPEEGVFSLLAPESAESSTVSSLIIGSAEHRLSQWTLKMRFAGDHTASGELALELASPDGRGRGSFRAIPLAIFAQPSVLLPQTVPASWPPAGVEWVWEVPPTYPVVPHPWAVEREEKADGFFSTDSLWS